MEVRAEGERERFLQDSFAGIWERLRSLWD